MCTLIIVRDVFTGYPLVVIANHDERLDRPAGPPKYWDRRPIPILAPVDEEAGGTWIGVSERGLFAAVTNRDDVPYVPGRPTRGTLVMTALEAPSATEARRRIEAVGGEMNGFNLVVADRNAAYRISGGGEKRISYNIASGLTVVTEQGCDTGTPGTRAHGIARRFRQIKDAEFDRHVLNDNLLAECDHSPVRSGTCIHNDDLNYGTRSSAILWASDGWRAFTYWHREGRPCRHGFGTPMVLPIWK